MNEDEGPVTSMPCPAGCDAGAKVSRLETRTGYAVCSVRCAYCSGTGMVSPERHSAYHVLVKGGKPASPECD